MKRKNKIKSIVNDLDKSRPMTSHYVIYHVTAVICLFIIQKKNKLERKLKEKTC